MGNRTAQGPQAEAVHHTRSGVAVTAVSWIVGLLLTLLVLFTPWVGVAVQSRTAHLVLQTADACIALLVAYLLWGRYVRATRLSDLLLVQSFLLLAVADLGVATGSARVLDEVGDPVGPWIAMALRLLGAVLLALAVLPASTAVPSRRATWIAKAAPWTIALLLSTALWLVRDILPSAVDISPPPVGVQVTPVPGHPLLAAGHLATACLMLSASVGFTARAIQNRDELARWLGPAFALGAFARVNYAINPTIYTDWLYAGDVLRTAFHAVLLVGALREVGQYWSRLAAHAVLEDRRRLAREIHDGVLQELTFIRSVVHDLPEGPATAREISDAATRAMDEARSAVHALRRLESEPLARVLQRAAREVAERHDLRLEMDVDPKVDTHPHQAHDLARITREALTNAARHGAARVVHLTLRSEHKLRVLSVRDDGIGFAPDSPPTRGSSYGLATMRERAAALPGTLDIDSEPGQGSVVTVTW